MKRAVCIRGLPAFKKGCPQHSWNSETGEGCPAWIEMPVAVRGNPQQKEIKGQCIDIWMWEFQWAALGMLEGNQQAMEGNRNMTALLSLSICNKTASAELIRVAQKHLGYTQQANEE